MNSLTRVARQAMLTSVLPVGAALLSVVGCAQSMQRSTQQFRTAMPVVVPAHPDSAWAADVAKQAFRQRNDSVTYQVVTFIPDRDGFLVRVVPTTPSSLGGGGVVWVSKLGAVVYLEIYQ